MYVVVVVVDAVVNAIDWFTFIFLAALVAAVIRHGCGSRKGAVQKCDESGLGASPHVVAAAFPCSEHARLQAFLARGVFFLFLLPLLLLLHTTAVQLDRHTDAVHLHFQRGGSRH